MTVSPELPDCGVYLVWPIEGTQWIHPEDVEIVSGMIPSNRVWRRTEYDGEYYHLHYGAVRIRVHPSMWLRVEDEGLAVGDQVEVLSKNLENDPCIGSIIEMRLDANSKGVRYEIRHRDQPMPHLYAVTDFTRLTPHIQLRESDTQNIPKPKMIDVPGLERLPIDLQ